MGAGRNTCINVINAAVISTSIVNSDVKFLRNRSTTSSVVVAEARGSGRVGGFDILISDFFWVFRDLISFGKGSGGLGGKRGASRIWVFALAGVALVGAIQGRLTFRRVRPRTVFVSGLGSGFPGDLVRNLGSGLGPVGFTGFGSWSGLVFGLRGG